MTLPLTWPEAPDPDSDTDALPLLISALQADLSRAPLPAPAPAGPQLAPDTQAPLDRQFAHLGRSQEAAAFVAGYAAQLADAEALRVTWLNGRGHPALSRLHRRVVNHTLAPYGRI